MAEYHSSHNKGPGSTTTALFSLRQVFRHEAITQGTCEACYVPLQLLSSSICGILALGRAYLLPRVGHAT